MDANVEPQIQNNNVTTSFYLPEKDRQLKNAFAVYKPAAYYSHDFLSNDGRSIYAESINLIKDNLHLVPTLKYLALTTFSSNYKGGYVDSRIKLIDYVIFGEKCDIELPLENTIPLNVSLYISLFPCMLLLLSFLGCKLHYGII